MEVERSTSAWTLGSVCVCVDCAPTVERAYQLLGAGDSEAARAIPLGRVAQGDMGWLECKVCGRQLRETND